MHSMFYFALLFEEDKLILIHRYFHFLYSVYGTLPNPLNNCYKNHPGKIEDFTPGHSSANDKERREVRT